MCGSQWVAPITSAIVAPAVELSISSTRSSLEPGRGGRTPGDAPAPRARPRETAVSLAGRSAPIPDRRAWFGGPTGALRALSLQQPPSTSRRGESGDRRSRKSPQPAASSAVPQSLRGGRIRCAVYTRKSSEEGLEQQFNSLDAQREACEAYVRSQKHEGWQVLPQLYDDPGFTGGTMDRPALKRLLS